jgi:hypothetical protein
VLYEPQEEGLKAVRRSIGRGVQDMDGVALVTISLHLSDRFFRPSLLSILHLQEPGQQHQEVEAVIITNHQGFKETLVVGQV